MKPYRHDRYGFYSIAGADAGTDALQIHLQSICTLSTNQRLDASCQVIHAKRLGQYLHALFEMAVIQYGVFGITGHEQKPVRAAAFMS